uniref:Uncharacterized protein n=1 Tax=Rhinolophus ferrumequinum TaxID=59479 RepID=A0A671FF94_RHIFE
MQGKRVVGSQKADWTDGAAHSGSSSSSSLLLPPPASGPQALRVSSYAWGRCHLFPQWPPRNRIRLGPAKRRSKKRTCIEDKTFGLENKKEAKQHKFIKAVPHQVKSGQQHPGQVAQSEAEKKFKKDDKKKGSQELNEVSNL